MRQGLMKRRDVTHAGMHVVPLRSAVAFPHDSIEGRPLFVRPVKRRGRGLAQNGACGKEEQGEEPYANTRNVTAGSVRLLDPRICAQRRLRMFCHGVGHSAGLKARAC